MGYKHLDVGPSVEDGDQRQLPFTTWPTGCLACYKKPPTPSLEQRHYNCSFSSCVQGVQCCLQKGPFVLTPLTNCVTYYNFIKLQHFPLR